MTNYNNHLLKIIWLSTQQIIEFWGEGSFFGSYLFSHGHATWGDDDISTADPLMQSWQQVIRAANTSRTYQSSLNVSQCWFTAEIQPKPKPQHQQRGVPPRVKGQFIQFKHSQWNKWLPFLPQSTGSRPDSIWFYLWMNKWNRNSKSFIIYEPKSFLLVSNNSKVDGGISVLLDGGQQCGPVRISNLSWVKVILRVQELHMHKQ